MLTAHVINGTRITVEVTPGSRSLTIYDVDGQLPPALERPIARRARAVIGDRLSISRVIVRFCDTTYRSQNDSVYLVTAAVQQALDIPGARAA